MATFAELQTVQTELIRKAKSGSAFLAPISATDVDETFVGPGGVLATLPADYEDLGWLSNDGMGFSRDVSTSDVTSFGSVSPTRSDVVSDTSTVTVEVSETTSERVGDTEPKEVTSEVETSRENPMPSFDSHPRSP